MWKLKPALAAGFLLVLPKFKSFDRRISPVETLEKKRIYKSEHLKGNFNYFIQIQSLLPKKPLHTIADNI